MKSLAGEGCGYRIASRARFLNKNHLVESYYATSQDKMMVLELNGVRRETYPVPWVKKTLRPSVRPKVALTVKYSEKWRNCGWMTRKAPMLF